MDSYTRYRWCLSADTIISKDIAYCCWGGNSTRYGIFFTYCCYRWRYGWSAYPYYGYRYCCRCATIAAVSTFAQVVSHSISAAWRTCWNNDITCTWVDTWRCSACRCSCMDSYTRYRCWVSTYAVVSQYIACCSVSSTAYRMGIGIFVCSNSYCWRWSTYYNSSGSGATVAWVQDFTDSISNCISA